MTQPHPTESGAAKTTLRSLAWLFLRLGTTAFGGPAAHIAMMEEEVVRRRGWLTHGEFLDLIGAANLIPGPSSTEVAIHVGYRVAGWPGLVLAGFCFILPAAILVSLLAWAYVAFGQLPAVMGVLYGIKPVVIAVVVQALWKLGRACVRTWLLAALAVIATVFAAVDVHPLLILFGVGVVTPLLRGLVRFRRSGPVSPLLVAGPAVPLGSVLVGATAPVAVGLWPLFLFFLKVGSVLFGSGYVLLAFLRADLIERYGWLSEQQLLDAVVVGQVTPGPVFTTATFIGFLLGGPVGAVVATVGIFLPGFVFVALSVPLLPRLRRSAVAGAFLDGVNVASLALMLVVTWQLGWAAIVDGMTALLAATSAVLLLRYHINTSWVVLAGAVFGVLHEVIARG